MQNKDMHHPTGADNPALEYFGYLLADDGLYPAEDTMIFCNNDWENGGSTSDVAVVYLPREYMRSKNYQDHPAVKSVLSRFNRLIFNSCSGNCDPDWMKYGNQKSPPPHDPDTNANFGFSPDEDFQCFRSWGFSSIAEAKRGVSEFARIRECAWARDGSIDPSTLVKTAATRKSEAELHEIKRQIYAEEQERCVKEFELEIKRRLSSGEMKCPKNVDMYFTALRLKAETAESNPGYLKIKAQWDRIRDKMICERDARIKQRESEVLL